MRHLSRSDERGKAIGERALCVHVNNRRAQEEDADFGESQIAAADDQRRPRGYVDEYRKRRHDFSPPSNCFAE